ncbi:MAG: MlaD family protein [Mycobacteriaceae bacterium]
MSLLKKMMLVTFLAMISVGLVWGGKFLITDREFCAEFTDAIGLYKGNDVQLLGMKVGYIKSIRNMNGYVEVDFDIDSDIALPRDVGAVTYSSSIVTDQHIELTKVYDGGAKFLGEECIPLERTKTPIGISDTFKAVSDLTTEILNSVQDSNLTGGTTDGAQSIGAIISATNKALQGSGPALRKSIENLSLILGNPYQSDSRIRSLISNMEDLTNFLVENWSDLANLFETVSSTVGLLSNISKSFASAVEKFSELIPTIKDNLLRYQDRIPPSSSSNMNESANHTSATGSDIQVPYEDGMPKTVEQSSVAVTGVCPELLLWDFVSKECVSGAVEARALSDLLVRGAVS